MCVCVCDKVSLLFRSHPYVVMQSMLFLFVFCTSFTALSCAQAKPLDLVSFFWFIFHFFCSLPHYMCPHFTVIPLKTKIMSFVCDVCVYLAPHIVIIDVS